MPPVQRPWRTPAAAPLFEALIESLAVGVVAFARNGRISHANRHARDLVGTGDSIVGARPETWLTALRPRTASGIAMDAEDLPPLRALAGEHVHGVDVLVRVAGRDLLLAMTALPATDRRGRIRGGLVTLEDVTEWRREEARWRRTVSMLHLG
jgi:PAS domain-containing protein